MVTKHSCEPFRVHCFVCSLESNVLTSEWKDTSMEYVGEHLAADLREVKTTEHLLGLMKNLKLSIEQKDEEIERICNGSYEDFISSFQEFVQHRRESEKVREELETIMEMSKSSGREIVLLGKEVDKAQVVLENIEKAMTTLSSCLPVLEAYSRLEKEISQKDYFNSLKSLEALESDLLPKLFPYNFASQMRQRLPVLKQEIKTAAQSELKDYLLNVRRLAPKIGRIAVDQAVKSSDAVEEVAAQNMVDLTPVHHCLHLYTLLESRQEFIDYYRIQRKKQVQLALEPPSSDLVSRAFLTSLWEEALAKIKQTIGNEASVSTDLTQMIRIKELILTFCHALKGFDLQIKDMMVIVSGIQDHYISLLMKKFVEIFRVIFNEDDYQPMEVRTEEEWRRLADAFPVVTETTEGQTAVAATNKFPRKFPFSAMVPKVFEQVKQFVDECLAFSSGMGLNIAQVRDAIRKWTKDLLSCTLCGCLCALLKKPTLGLTHLMQIFVNMNHLEEAKHHVEAYIGAVTGWTGDAATLDRKDMFKEACAEAEHQIYEKLREKIDEFVELNSYDWMLDEAEGHASSYMLDLVAFLENTFQAFVNRGLPLKVGTAACIHACQHIGQKMLPVLLDPGIKQMTNGALMQFNMDVLQCEQFACSAPIPGIDETALLLCFADVRQILDLFTAWDWSTYFHDVGKEKSKYLRVSPQVALMLLERLDRGSEKKPLFTSLKKTERDKKKLMEAVQKQLKYLCRSQQQDNHSAS
ncbi:unnamed protein product [Notodromas monacha]|uniref:Exocyst complex component n=1 Tax=Notodromas monacha TaxID=399045 RepID=A0A7R9BUM4_9CRUS|nr:unnamed protein product [Notodromas monacha]CAG0922041.1 unnamed protein product [Notodromas monacha]